MVTESPEPASGSGLPRRPAPPLSRKVSASILLLLPIVALMWVGSYAKATPRLLGFPFFYWYQLMWLLLGAGCTGLAYLLLRSPRTPDPGATDRVATGGGEQDPAGGAGQ